MTSPTEQRRTFDAAIAALGAADTRSALAGFTAVTGANPAMADAWLGRLACGDVAVDTLAAAHANSRALYRETRRIGVDDGELHAVVTAPLYVTHPVWSRGSIAVAYAGALIGAGRYSEAEAVLDEPVLTADTQALQWRQLLQASLFHITRRWTDVRAVTAVCPPVGATHLLDEVTAATTALSAAAAASLGEVQTALDLARKIRTANP